MTAVTSATATSAAENASADYPAAAGIAERAAARPGRRLCARTERTLARFALDAAMLALGAALAEAGWRGAGFPPSPLAWVVAFPLVSLALLYVRGLYVPYLRFELLAEIRKLVGATAVAAMAVTTARVVLSDEAVPSTQAVRPWLFATACLVAGRVALGWADARAKRRGETTRPTLIVGAGRIGQLVARRLLERPELGLKPIGFLDKEPLGAVDGVPVLGASWDFERVAAAHDVQHVIVTFSTAPHDVVLRLATQCEQLGIDVSFVPRLFEKVPERMTVEHIGGLPLVTPRPADPKGWQFAVKYAFDRVAAAVLLVVLAPVLALAAASVFVTMGRPVFFRQPRVGLDGREFRIVKLRSMRGRPEEGGEADADWMARELGDAEASEAPAEDRATPVGQLLRRCSLDELPQLWNVLRGEMSIVGPRPERVHYARRFETNVRRYAERHRVKSGMTGWAQVNGLRGKTSLADRVEWDNYYIENWSLWLDLEILLRTPAALSSHKGLT